MKEISIGVREGANETFDVTILTSKEFVEQHISENNRHLWDSCVTYVMTRRQLISEIEGMKHDFNIMVSVLKTGKNYNELLWVLKALECAKVLGTELCEIVTDKATSKELACLYFDEMLIEYFL